MTLHTKPKESGFTLIELMITVVILIILTSIALPDMRAFINSTRLSSSANDILADLALARSEAIKRGIPVSVCASSNGSSCTGGNWSDGHIVFSDSGGTSFVGNGVVDTANDTVIRVAPSSGANITISASGFSNASFLSYGPTGSASTISNTSPGAFKICDDHTANHGRQVSVMASGRTAISSTTLSCP